MPEVQFVATDFIQEYLDIGETIARNLNIKNISFRKINWFDLKVTDEFDGVISLQTISCLPEPNVRWVVNTEGLNNIYEVSCLPPRPLQRKVLLRSITPQRKGDVFSRF